MSIVSPDAAAALSDVVKNALASGEEEESDEDEVWYGVQIMGLGRKISEGDKAFKGLKVTAVKAADSSVYKYVTARSADVEKAKASLKEVRTKFPEAFVVKVEGNDVSRVR